MIGGNMDYEVISLKTAEKLAKLVKLEKCFAAAISYIENELFRGIDDLEWQRRNSGCISGSDLPSDVIIELYDILKNA